MPTEKRRNGMPRAGGEGGEERCLEPRRGAGESKGLARPGRRWLGAIPAEIL